MGLKVHRPDTVYMGDVLASGSASFTGASLILESAVIAWDLGLHGGTWILGPWEPTRCQLPLMGPQYLGPQGPVQYWHHLRTWFHGSWPGDLGTGEKPGITVSLELGSLGRRGWFCRGLCGTRVG